jgi:hypothetical protein
MRMLFRSVRLGMFALAGQLQGSNGPLGGQRNGGAVNVGAHYFASINLMKRSKR